jgi:hypothetical protein
MEWGVGLVEWKWLQIERFQPTGEIEPLPTIPRQVSGKKNRSGRKKDPAAMARNQKIDCQPRYLLRTPPRIGPREGARIFPSDAKPMYIPRSAEVIISAATADARATVPLLPQL